MSPEDGRESAAVGPLDPSLARRRQREREMRLRSLPKGSGDEVDLADFGLADGLAPRSVAFYFAAVFVVWGIASVVPSLGFAVPMGVAYVLLPGAFSWWLTNRTGPPPPPPGLDYDRIAQLERSTEEES